MEQSQKISDTHEEEAQFSGTADDDGVVNGMFGKLLCI